MAFAGSLSEHIVAAAVIVAALCGSAGACLGGPDKSRRQAPATPMKLAPAVLRCSEAIDSLETPPAGFTVFRGIVALRINRDNRVAHQTSEDLKAAYGERHFAKAALLVRAGAKFKMVIPEARRGMTSIAWGYGGTPRTWELTVPGCPGSTGWKVFTGGFWLEDPGCVEVIIRDGEHEEVLQLNLGSPCPSARSKR